MKFHDFVDLKQLSKEMVKNRTKNTSGEPVNWLLIKSFKFSKASPGIIYYRYNHTDEYMSLEVCGRGGPRLVKILPKMYHNTLPISKLKKHDLMKLYRTGVIPEEFHGRYNDLQTSDEVKDTVPEPAVEDSGDQDSDE